MYAEALPAILVNNKNDSANFAEPPEQRNEYIKSIFRKRRRRGISIIF